jgi:hypothetical protein
LQQFNEINFLDRFSKIIQILNLMKIGPVGAEFFHADGQIDKHDEANIRFSKFWERAYKFSQEEKHRSLLSPTSL